MTSVRDLNPNDLDRAGETLGRAFENDPMFRWIFPDPAVRASSFRALIRVPLRYGLRFGRVTQSNDAQAVSIWIPPESPLSMIKMVRCGMLAVPFHIGFGPFSRFLGANMVMDRLLKEHGSEPHWYLFGIGVSPERQGRGLGTALIIEGLQRADQDGHPCYLETSSQRNLPYYERFGFSVVGEAPLGKGGPTGWAMKRDVP